MKRLTSQRLTSPLTPAICVIFYTGTLSARSAPLRLQLYFLIRWSQVQAGVSHSMQMSCPALRENSQARSWQYWIDSHPVKIDTLRVLQEQEPSSVSHMESHSVGDAELETIILVKLGITSTPVVTIPKWRTTCDQFKNGGHCVAYKKKFCL